MLSGVVQGDKRAWQMTIRVSAEYDARGAPRRRELSFTCGGTEPRPLWSGCDALLGFIAVQCSTAGISRTSQNPA